MTKLHVKIRTEGQTDQLLAQLPKTLREKWLRTALRKAARVVAKEVQRRAPVGDDPGFDTEENEKPLSASIRGRAFTESEKKIVGRVETFGVANTYAAAVEYGHELVLPGQIQTGQFVPSSPFFRPAVDSTRKATDRMIRRELERALVEVERDARGLRG